jgi:hypothetical protein
MLNKLDRLKEEMAFALFGRSPRLSKTAGQCVKCGEFNLEFRDEISRKEYGISCLCQCCQDGIFGGPEGDDEKEETLAEAQKFIPGFFVPPEALDGLEN